MINFRMAKHNYCALALCLSFSSNILASDAGSFVASASTGSITDKPNILLVMLDDVGYADLNSYGSQIDTPAIDAIANDGIRYANFHATPTCSPSRASVLTGREAHRVGMGLVSRFDLGPRFPAFRGRITDQAATIAEVLGKENYGTYGVGKWHLLPTSHMQPSGPFDHWPSGKGFQRFYGFLAGSTDLFKPELFEDNHFVEREYGEGYFLPRDMTDKAIKMLHNHVSYSPERPFFMYYSTPGMHAPHQAEADYIAKYEGKFAAGWDQITAQRLAKQQALGLIPEGVQVAPKDERIESWDQLSSDAQQGYEKLQEVYAALLDQTDHELGRLIAELKSMGIYDNTIIVVLSDNGGSQEGGINGAVNHSSHYSGVDESVADIVARIDEIGTPTAASNYPLGWARASNAPFKYFKQDTFGGGINVPFIIKPVASNQGGEIRHQYHHISDVMPTLLELVDVEIPTTFNGIEQLPVDGISMQYSFAYANAKDARTTQFYRMGHHRGIYHEGWTAVTRHKPATDYDDDDWELFNLNEDISQSNNLAQQYPDKVEELKRLWKKHGEELNGDFMIDPKNPGFLIGTFLKLKKWVSPPPAQQTYHFLPQASYVTEKSSPNITNKSFDIVAHLHHQANTGVVFTYGNADSGLVLYLKDGIPVFEYNYLENVPSVGQRYQLTASKALPAGDNTISVRVTKLSEHQAKAELVVNGETVDQIATMNTLAGRVSHEGAGIGKHWSVPTSPNTYAMPALTDAIQLVSVTVYNN